MKKLGKILFLATVVIFVTSCCGLKKMVKRYDEVKHISNPEVLETHGGKVAVEIRGTFPDKYFDKRAVVEFQPVLKYEGGTLPLKSIKIKGEKVKEGEGSTIKKKGGGSFTYVDTFDFIPEMKSSQLVVNAKGSRKKKSAEFSEIKLADGVIATSTRIGWDEEPALAAHGYAGPKTITKKANHYFDYNDARLLSAQKLNKKQENIDKIKELQNFIELGWEIKNVEINAWASPEGEESRNTDLSKNRGKATESWLVSYMNDLDKKIAKIKKVKIDSVKRKYPLNVNARGEDFDGFMATIQASSLKEKQAIINVIKMQTEKAKREQEIKNMAVIYAEIEAILEPLRRGEIVVSCIEPAKTDEEIAALAVTDPGKLDEREINFAATLTNDIEAKLKIYKAATVVHPNDWKGFNNAGYILITKRNLNEAAVFIEKANALFPNNAVVMNNLGVLESGRKNYDKAKEYYSNAQAGGINVDYNIGVPKIYEGAYDEALSLFKNKSCKYNIALAQILKKNYPEAVTNLDCMAEKDAMHYYLKAVIGARTGNTSMMYDNLKQAVAKDAKLKEEAKKDREFLKYFESSDFQNAIK